MIIYNAQYFFFSEDTNYIKSRLSIQQNYKVFICKKIPSFLIGNDYKLLTDESSLYKGKSGLTDVTEVFKQDKIDRQKKIEKKSLMKPSPEDWDFSYDLL